MVQLSDMITHSITCSYTVYIFIMPLLYRTSKYIYCIVLCSCRTYFVEYQFPVVAASRDNSERNTSATETVRAVSKKVDKSGGESATCIDALQCNMILLWISISSDLAIYFPIILSALLMAASGTLDLR